MRKNKSIICFLFLSILTGLVLISASCSTENSATLPTDINDLIDQERYADSYWGILVTDLATGEPIYSMNTSGLFIPASVTKLIPTAAALDYLGADYEFKTPVYKTGVVSGGVLEDNLVLVASGDPTMGGRTTPDNKIAFENFDHGDANALPYATLTKEDPLAGLNDLARQIKEQGISTISGDVVIDDRLFETTEKDEYVLSPIMINDNMIDLIIDPTTAGQPARVEYRPQVPGYTVTAQVETVAAGGELDVRESSGDPGQIIVAGQIPEDQGELIKTYQIMDPAPFARALFIQALQNNGITVSAPVSGPNPSNLLPEKGSYKKDDQVAELISPPLSEDIKLTNKVSQNMHADNLIELIAVNNGTPGFDKGMQLLVPFFDKAGVDTNSMALSDGRGGGAVGVFSPEQITTMLRYMSTRDDFEIYKDSLPIMGVDGSFAVGGIGESPADGKLWAKTGTMIQEDVMHDRAFLKSKALSGYIDAASGRELVFALFVNNAPLETPEDVIAVHQDLIRLAEMIYNEN
jgi:D-alanyl-D-alanine carboxypeptidase/D-alanyl-D-alanine-endopeptidase (penicillin-binding protein 4)